MVEPYHAQSTSAGLGVATLCDTMADGQYTRWVALHPD